MTALAQILARRIAATGPLTLADYMSECLLHPVHGYYTTHDPFGAEGDFITAPEVSQMFGELLGLALAQVWMDQGRPNGVLAELGPGRGTLMADILRATSRVPGFHAAMRPRLVEASPRLRQIQAQRLTDAHGDIAWCDQVQDLPQGPLFLVANEFFDALPIRQFVRDAQAGWRERQVGLDGDGRLSLGLGPALPQPELDHRKDVTVGQLVETCAPARPIMQEIDQRIARFGGGALIIDYGDWQSLGDTFQALRNHQKTDPLDAPGAADLTAHVDFQALAQAVRGCKTSEMTPQGVVLERLGITERARALAASLAKSMAASMGEAALDAHIQAHRRLTHPQEMGNLFKMIALTPKSAPAFPGLDDDQ